VAVPACLSCCLNDLRSITDHVTHGASEVEAQQNHDHMGFFFDG